MRRRVLLVPLLGAVLAAAGLSVQSGVHASQEAPFPHARHQGLFPLCTGCHEGIPTGDPADWYPDPNVCSGCHDGVQRVSVTWTGPSRRIDNVAFDHERHADGLAQAGDPEQVCANCHIPSGGGRMEVAASIQTATCFSCHQHQTDDHFATTASCQTCHVPLAESGFSRSRIERLQRPSTHEGADFVLQGHGQNARAGTSRCATCHTQERCVTCHVDASLPEIAELPRAPAAMDLPTHQAHYPEPASHLDSRWLDVHQTSASVGECATCHTSNDCRTCHVSSIPDVVAALPMRDDVVAPGVMLAQRPPASHGSMFFMQAHSVLASTDQASCQTCHVERFCVECHEGPVGGGYHPANFMTRHAADAYGRATECANCHEPRVFCRACHEDMGLAGGRPATSGYHDATPIWLLQHGQAARRQLESCASCHKQVDCTRCHGVLGAFKVSPHSADFDAERAWAQSPRTCLACHIGNPNNGEEP